MPRYYFHIFSDDVECPDRKGEPHDDDAQAIAMARRIVSEIAEEPEHREIEVKVVGRKGRAVATVDINGLK
ncbi:DUF6894 family protein [Pelagibacterium luteolum]|uniref:DUF6894 domain-containing protein n=1 Tax=Pelagibacterium luteolum TaxID=440168 RepID=A0A1G7YSD5_9HYPH|nr:hypothetical protein [Pelagibacterium luteolum]SDG99109.1 hypothetical protein SAMN04487974_11542 [Pelagibacterium luteolum]